MTYQQVWDTMSKKEKMALSIMDYCDVGDDGYWVRNSVRNKILYRIAKFILGGVDPLDRIGFYGMLLSEDLLSGTVPELMADLYGCKVAWARF